MILIIKHISIEGPGTIGEFFKSRASGVKTIELDRGDKLPGNLSRIEAIIVLGGPMNVYEEDKYPFLKDENIFLKKTIKEKVPILGICLGAQLLAKACGAAVRRAEKEEVGWYKVQLTDRGKKDPLFKGLERELDVFQWHQDTFDIPEKRDLLATSLLCKNQAFRFGENAYALQFHIEVTEKEIGDWVREYRESNLKAQQILLDYYRMREKFNRQAKAIYLNFATLVDSCY